MSEASGHGPRGGLEPAFRDRLESGLGQLGCEALVVVASTSRDPDIAPFVGRAHLGECFVVAPRGGVPRLGYLTPMERGEAAASGCQLLPPELLDVARLRRETPDRAAFWATLLERALGLAGVGQGSLALAGRAPAGIVAEASRRLERSGWPSAAGHELLLALRKRKAAGELAAARAAAEATCRAMRRAAELLATAEPRQAELWHDGARLTAGRLRRTLALSLAACGLEQPEGNIVAGGAEAAVPHTQGSCEHVLRAGEAIIIDLYPRGSLFADCTRTFCVGEPPERLRRAWSVVAETLRAVAEQARAGTTGWELQLVACERLGGAGYPTPVSRPGTTVGYVHGLGHGVGYELHEYPSFREQAGEAGRLEAGDVFTLEPGLYDEAEGYGLRLENLYALTEEGLEDLTPLPLALDPRAWRP